MINQLIRGGRNIFPEALGILAVLILSVTTLESEKNTKNLTGMGICSIIVMQPEIPTE
jgi:hypothetical protein